MEALAALGLASNVVQFISFANELLGTGLQIHRSAHGLTRDHADLAASATQVRVLAKNIELSLVSVSEQGRYDVRVPAAKLNPHLTAIQSTSQRCHELAQNLVSLLEDLKPKSNDRMDSAKAVAKVLWKTPRLKEMKDQLAVCKQDLNLHLGAALLNDHSFLTLGLSELKDAMSKTHVRQDETLELLRSLRDEFQSSLPTGKSSASLFARDESQLVIKELDILFKQQSAFNLEEHVLRQLWFEGAGSRERQIVKQHQATYEWAFQKDINFCDWLENQEGVYWVTGKPGSGKSTFMKYLYSEPRTLCHLEKWCSRTGGHELKLSNFYFWAAGSPMMRSIEGLVRSLLFNILSKQRGLIHRMLNADDDLENFVRRSNTAMDFETLKSLLSKLVRLKNEDGDMRFCFFVDGLDEYDGYDQDTVDAIEEFQRWPNVKLVVSSRPHNAFKTAFQPRGYYLSIDFHTEGDIRKYADDSLRTHPAFEEILREDDRVNYEAILEQICKKARGVFLWVTLVIRRMRQTMPDIISFQALEIIVSELPSDLEDFFERMISEIPPKHHTTSACIFLQLMLDAEKEIPFFLVAPLLDPHTEIALLPARQGPRLMSEFTFTNPHPLEKMVSLSCGDLLEFGADKLSGANPLRKGQDKIGSSCTIRFFHKTVLDYLMLPRNRAVLESRLPSELWHWTMRSRAALTIYEQLCGLIKPYTELALYDIYENWKELLNVIDHIFRPMFYIQANAKALDYDLIDRAIQATPKMLLSSTAGSGNFQLPSWVRGKILQYGLYTWLQSRLSLGKESVGPYASVMWSTYVRMLFAGYSPTLDEEQFEASLRLTFRTLLNYKNCSRLDSSQAAIDSAFEHLLREFLEMYYKTWNRASQPRKRLIIVDFCKMMANAGVKVKLPDSLQRSREHWREDCFDDKEAHEFVDVLELLMEDNCSDGGVRVRLSMQKGLSRSFRGILRRKPGK